MLLISPDVLQRVCQQSTTVDHRNKELQRALKPKNPTALQLAEIKRLLNQYQQLSEKARQPIEIPVEEVDSDTPLSPVTRKSSVKKRRKTATPQDPAAWQTLGTPTSSKSVHRRDRSKPGSQLARYRPKSRLKTPKRLTYK